jgi:signal transduction histidine kinase
MKSPLKETFIPARPSRQDGETESRFDRASRLQKVTRSLLRAQEEERQQVAQRIHDEIGNRIALIAFSIREKIQQDRGRFHSTDESLEKVLTEITELSVGLREISQSLCPASLRYAGVIPALKTLQDSFEKENPVKIHLAIPSELPPLQQSVHLSIFRTAEDSLRYLVGNSGANKVRILLDVASASIRLTVSGNGKELKVDELEKATLRLLIMQERARSIGGQLSAKRSPRAGTEIILSVPVAENVVSAANSTHI